MSNVLKVSGVKNESQGEKVGIQVGDVVASYNGNALDSSVGLSNAIHNAKESRKEKVELGIWRGDQHLLLDVTTDPLGIECIEGLGSIPKSSQSDDSIDYKTSIFVAKIVSASGWLTCVVAVALVISAFASVGKMGALSLLPGIGVLIGGLILVIAGQTSRAIMDNTNYSRQMLEEMRKKT